MTEDQIIELAIQGHASTRDAIRWAIKQKRDACLQTLKDAGQEKKALRLALEALEQWNTPLYKRATVITAINEVLAQPEQEPVAWVSDREARMVWWNDKFTDIKQAPPNNTPLYTTPPQRKPLTDEQKMALCKQFPDHLTFNAIHAIEAAHNIKE